MAEHARVAQVREALAAYNRGDIAAMSEHFSDDILWHVGGDHPHSGDYRGRDDVVRYLEDVRSDASIELEPTEILASDEHAGIFMRVHAEREGKSLDNLLAEAITFDREGRWSEYWALADDQSAIDDFWKEG